MHIHKPSSKKIPKTLFTAPEEILKQKIQHKYGYLDQRGDCDDDPVISQATEAALLKYYPKYCHTVRLDNKSKRWFVVSRIKQIKSISYLEYDLGAYWKRKPGMKKMKEWLQNKRKSVKSLPVIELEEESGFFLRHITAMEMCSFLPQIKTLKVCLPLYGIFRSRIFRNDWIPASIEDQIVDTYGRFWDLLKHVKHLEILANPALWIIFPHLQKSQRFLSSLQSFRLTIISERSYPVETPTKFFQSFLRFTDVLKYVTHLNLQRLKDQAEVGLFHLYGDQIKAILDGCTKLRSLIFPVEKEFYETHFRLSGPKHYLTLAPLQSLKNLRELDLIVYDIWSFCIAFEFPPQLKKLALRLYRIGTRRGDSRRFEKFFINEDSPHQEESFRKESDQFVNDGEKDKTKFSRQIRREFFEKVSKLAQLKSLKLVLDQSDNILKNFVVPLLQAVPKLEQFECKFYGKNGPIDLSILLNEIIPRIQLQPFGGGTQLLKNFHFVTSLISITYQALSFPNISIGARFSEDFDFRAFFMAFSEGIKQKEINLAKIHVSSISSLLKLLRIFKEVEQFPKLKISLDLELQLRDWEDINKYLEETIIPAKNVCINLKVYPAHPEQVHPSIEAVRTLQKAFAKIKLSLALYTKVTVVTSWNQYEKTIDLPVIRDGHYSAYGLAKITQDELCHSDSSVEDSNYQSSFRSSDLNDYNTAEIDDADEENPQNLSVSDGEHFTQDL